MSIQTCGAHGYERKFIIVCGLVLLALLGRPVAAIADEPITVFAAASLTDVLQEIGEAYKAKTGKAVRFSFTSSSTLARQIEAGAPAQIYASANEQWMDYLAERNLIETETRASPVSNQLVLIAPVGTALGPVTISSSTDLAKLLGADSRLSVGNTDSVPAGIYAKEALQSLGLWTALEPRLAPAEDVRAALAHVERGETPLGIVYATDAKIDRNVKVLGTFPPGSYKPITYPFAVVRGKGSAVVRDFFAYLTGPDAMRAFEKYGFKKN
jgi:molybdate transport system substrate-binding protein